GFRLEDRGHSGGDTSSIRVEEDATSLRIVAPTLRVPKEQLPALFDPVLQADPRVQRMRFDIRLLIAQQLLARNAVEITAAVDTGSGGTVVSITFPTGSVVE